jgi:all-trans-8'-apo-beta-carotenal 15,15'-oxygenase
MARSELENANLVSRRATLRLAALGGGGFALGGLAGCADAGSATAGMESAVSALGKPTAPLFVGGLTTSLREELRYAPLVRGRLPHQLCGTLYKNGPGLFERAGVRRRTLLDGDGMISAYRFAHGRVEFQNRFVRTPKFEAEEAAQRFLLDTWTTPIDEKTASPGSDQAGVTVWPWGERLYAFDEGNPGWRLDPDDLRTLGPATFGLAAEQAAVFAHAKQLANSGELTLFGVNYAKLQYNYLGLDAAHRVIDQRHFAVTDYGAPSYMHDWFLTPRYFVLHVMPALIDGAAIAGGSVLRDALRWQRELPSRLLVFRRGETAPPQVFEMPPTWMWHSANAFELRDARLVLDWVGYDDPYHFVGAGAEWESIMQGQLKPSGAPGVLRRTVLDLKAKTLATERFEDIADQEFPVVAPGRAGKPHRYVYLVHEPGAGVLYQALAKVDMRTGRTDVFDFGAGLIALEPVFAPRPGGSAEDDGWLLVEVANELTGRAALNVFDARRLADGPIASVQLRHHIPMRFHGRWAGA